MLRYNAAVKQGLYMRGCVADFVFTNTIEAHVDTVGKKVYEAFGPSSKIASYGRGWIYPINVVHDSRLGTM